MLTADKTPSVTGTTISPDSFAYCGVLTSTAENPRTPHLELIIGALAGWGQAAAPRLDQAYPGSAGRAPGASLRPARSRD